MNLKHGLWGILDQGLQRIGRSAARLLLRRHSATEESALYAATGGALVCAVFGAVVGFALSNPSRDIGAIDGTILGGSLGMCMGILFGSFVKTVDSTIKDLLRSLNSK